MEENVALDSKNQEKFSKSIKGIQKLIKAGKIKDKKDKPTKPIQKDKKQKRRIFKKRRGLVYISHIPHGFYENEMTQYFKQFGVVTNARVIRSKKTGKSRGCAFVEFLQPAVAEIVAQTMNNYLMGKRLLKAVYIPPENQRKAGRKFWNETNNPGANKRLKQKKEYNDNGTEADDLKVAKKLISNFLQTKEKLKDLGLNYDFFKPVDVPEILKDKLEPKCNIQETPVEISSIKVKKSAENKVNLKPKAHIQDIPVEISSIKVKKPEENKVNIKPKAHTTTKINNATITHKKNEDAEKGKKEKDMEFIKLEHQNEDDSSEDKFDSDEFEMIIESDESNDSLASDSSDNDHSNMDSAKESDENEKLLHLDISSDSEESESERRIKMNRNWAKKATKSPLLLKPKKEMGKRKNATGHLQGKNIKMKPSQNKKKNRS